VVGCGGEPAAPAPLPCGIAPIERGFGAPGPYTVVAHTVANPDWPGQRVERFVPREATGPVPVIALAHAFNVDDPARYRGLIGHLVSRGSAVVFPAYAMAEGHARRVDALFTGLRAALREPSTPPLDTSRLGLIGHSYGGGALPVLALRATDAGWGGKALFLAFLAPWFDVDPDAGALTRLPEQTRALFLVFQNDSANDHRIAIDLFRRLSLPDAAKDYVMIGADAHDGCSLPAVHTLPMSSGLRAAEDALDVYGLWRLLDALVAASFAGDADAARVALGHGSPEQVRMGHFPDGAPMRELLGGPDPQPAHDPSYYLFRFDQRERWLQYGAVH
jgi:hypothetical protein